ncbi:hypothetical protein [Chromobacterium haemolyticum]|uniref:hypothetical protein n=1 Tax=Chromobacterium haemolyticum TaxID=394935 RepID=UPI001316CD12|nr:hypothetical protein [Chromobacterium haemolyticum]BBH14163.1 hypothetical protein CH06BL_34110 [Chromobacterium haemolyticum]
MIDIFYNAIISSFSSIAVVSLLAFLVKNWFIERLKASVGYEYSAQLENLKSELSMKNNGSIESLKHEVAKEFSAISMAHKTLEGSIAISQQKKVESVEKLWSGIVALKNATPSAFTTVDILLEEEFDKFNCTKIKDAQTFKTGEIFGKLISLTNTDGTAELTRLHVGEKLWFLFFAYRALYLRLSFEISEGIKKNSLSPWYKTTGMRKMLENFFKQEDLDKMDAMELSKFSYLTTILEGNFLDEARRIVSGQDVSGDAIKYAMLLREYSKPYEST